MSWFTKILRRFVWFALLLLPLHSVAQIRRPVAAPEDRGDYGRKFFDDLRSLFGRLQQADLDRAFQRAKSLHCSDLAGQSGEWKEVAFLNDDRKLGDWHFESIEDVRNDLTTFVFSGACSSENDSLKVATSYAVQETADKYVQGKIPLTQVVMSDNAPVTLRFDENSGAYVFEL